LEKNAALIICTVPAGYKVEDNGDCSEDNESQPGEEGNREVEHVTEDIKSFL
jgi:hypothetical protein